MRNGIFEDFFFRRHVSKLKLLARAVRKHLLTKLSWSNKLWDLDALLFVVNSNMMFLAQRRVGI